MFTQTNLFHAILIIPILNILLLLYGILVFLHIPGPLGFSVILLTVVIRLLLHPLTVAQLKSAQKLQKLKPEIDRLNTLHKEDKQKLQQEQLRLYKDAGVNPAAGCLPLLLQMPILIALYNLFFQILGATDISKIINNINNVAYVPFLRVTSLDLSFFGLNLAHKPSDWQKEGVLLLLIPVVTGALQYIQTKLMSPTPAKQDINGPEKKKDEDMASAMQKQMGIMMPLMIGFFAYSFPLGLSLYWNTFTVFGIIQQYKVNQES